MTDTSWVVPGAAIAVYIDGREGCRRLRHATVKSVAGKSFLVDGISQRFKFDTMETKEIGDTWSHWNYVAAHPDSNIVREVAERDERDRLRSTVRPYLGDGSEDLARVDEAIERLKAWRAILAGRTTPPAERCNQ
jgi:hypothetical protein